MEQVSENQLKNEVSFRNFLSGKHWKDILLVCIVLIVILFARFMNFISNDVTGSLLGAATGYGLAGLRKLHE